MKHRILSYSINQHTPLYRRTPRPKINPYRQMSKGDSSNSFIITVHSHTGTHVESARHFTLDGRAISDYPLDELVFTNPLIVDCPKNPGEHIVLEDIISQKLNDADCLIFNTGFWRFRDRNKDIYRKQNPGIMPDVIHWVRKESPTVRCIGVDSVSISAFQYREQGREAHKVAFVKKKNLGEPLIFIEDMNLGTLSTDDKLGKVAVIPWQILGVDSAPCIVLAEVI